MKKQIPQSSKCLVINNRLVFYKKKADSEYWDSHWDDILTEDYYKQALQGSLGKMEKIFLKHLPKEGTILEGGCGLAKLVVGLRARGYDCVGLEWGERTVEKVKEKVPDLPIFQGDLTQTHFEDNALSAYISLGVVEHTENGPSEFFREAYRIIQPNGYFLVSVPCFNPLRRFKAKMGAYQSSIEDEEFYQYAFQKDEMKELLQSHGFSVLTVYSLSAYKGLKDELPGIFSSLLKQLSSLPRIGWRFKSTIDNIPPLPQLAGHMAMYICQKVENNTERGSQDPIT